MTLRLCFCLATLAATASAAAPIDLALAPNVRDPIFAMLLAYARADRFGVVTRDDVAQNLAARRLSSRLPWQGARDFERAPALADGSATLTVRFEEPVNLRVPYRILWYQPGRIRASASSRFREWRLSEIVYEARGAKGALRDVHLYALEEGRLMVDLPGWLDALFGGALDDTWIEALAVGRLRGREYGFAVGRNREGQSRIGVFDLTANEVVFPIPDELRAPNRAVRREFERRAGAAASR